MARRRAAKIKMNEPINKTSELQADLAGPRRPELSQKQKRCLLRAAAGVVAATAKGERVTPADVGLGGFDEVPVAGGFVVLKRAGLQRISCGAVSRSMSLAQAVFGAAARAAAGEQRSPPLTPRELPYLHLSLWMLHSRRQLTQPGDARRDAVMIGKHGLQIVAGDRVGLLLPSAPAEHQLDTDGFLRLVCLKAGLPPTAWKDEPPRLYTFEGEAIAGEFRDFPEVTAEAEANSAAPRLTPSDVDALADVVRGNMHAAMTGATPSYYTRGIADGNVRGVTIALRHADGSEWLLTNQFTPLKTMPLQATLFSLAEEAGRNLASRGIDPRRIAEAHVDLGVLYDAAVQGTLAAPDLRGMDAKRHALVIVEGRRSALVFNPFASADHSLAEILQKVRGLVPGAMLYSTEIVANVPSLTVACMPEPHAGPRTRPPAVAGSYYPDNPLDLNALLDDLTRDCPAVKREAWSAVMLPHAEMAHSGRLAINTLLHVDIPEHVLVIGPKHGRLGMEWAVAPNEAWSIPGGKLFSDPAFARELAAAIPGLELDAEAHQREHTIEAVLPLIARLAPHARVTGIVVGSGNVPRCRDFAEGLAACLRNRPGGTLLVISSDMHHFADDAETRRLDDLALAAMETLDPAALYEVVMRHRISMCGMLPAVIVMETLRRLDGLARTRRVGHVTSGDATGERRRVVGYAGMLLG